MAIKNISYCPDNAKNPPKLKYGSRINHGHQFERDLRAVLLSYGIVTSPTGRALLSTEFQAGLNQLNDQTSKSLRFYPDLAGRLPNGGGCILIEAKSTLSETRNYAINTASYIYQRDLVLNSDPKDLLRLLYIFRPLNVGEDFRAEWVQNLHRAITKRVNDREVLRASLGSGSPYLLIAGNRLRTLSAVLRELIEPIQKHYHGDGRAFRKEEHVNGLYGR